MAHLLIVANDVMGARMGAPGIRCYELARELAKGGNRVTVVGGGPSDLADGSLEVVPRLGHTSLDRLARSHDAILLEGTALVRYPSLRRVRAPLIVDLYDPFPLEWLEQGAHRGLRRQEPESREILGMLRTVLHGGDFFLCASEVQRDLWLGALLHAGRITPRVWAQDRSLRRLIDVVPFGLPSEPPQGGRHRDQLAVGALTDTDVVILWAGGLYNWLDPLTLIRAVGMAAVHNTRIKLIFMSTSHPNPEMPEQMRMPERANRLAAELGLGGRHVFFNDAWVPYHDRSSWLLAADCGVSTHFDSAESRYSFRTRILDYLWCGLPIICTAGDHFANLVAERDLGWVVPPQDAEALSAAILAMAADEERRRAVSRRVADVAQSMTWGQVAAPLRDFLAQPAVAADRSDRSLLFGRVPTALEVQAAEGVRLLRRAGHEALHGGPGTVARKAGRWWRARP